MNYHRLGALAVAVTTVAVAAGASTSASFLPDTEELRLAVTVDQIRAHQAAWQDIADRHGHTRAAGSPGYDASVDYVVQTLRNAGYDDVVTQEFTFVDFYLQDPSGAGMVLSRQVDDATDADTDANAITEYTLGLDYVYMENSDPGDVTAPVVPVDLLFSDDVDVRKQSTSGCESSDFEDLLLPSGSNAWIALMQYGGCEQGRKAENAAKAGAVAAIIMEAGDFPLLSDIGKDYKGGIPVFVVGYSLGVEWTNAVANATETETPVVLHMVSAVVRQQVTTSNVWADYTYSTDTDTQTETGMIVVGAHMDSVRNGPGVNDNGSGAGAILEIASQIKALDMQKQPCRPVRFVWFSGEEVGRLGSIHYVDQLTSTDVKKMEAYVNVDMIGSPNYVRFVYDGDGSNLTQEDKDQGQFLVGPPGSDLIEQTFLDYFQALGQEAEPWPMRHGKSDYSAFSDVGVPVGGVISFNFGLKTDREQAIYGGEASVSYDTCYHQECDDLNNTNNVAIGELSGAIAHTVLALAMRNCSINTNAEEEAPMSRAPTSAHGGSLTVLGAVTVVACWCLL